MKKVLKSLSLVTENCEIFTFDAKYIKRFSHYLSDDNTCNKTDIIQISFDEKTELNLTESNAFSLDWKNRVDITVVKLVYTDNSIQLIDLPWPDGEKNRYLTEHPHQQWDNEQNPVFKQKLSFLWQPSSI